MNEDDITVEAFHNQNTPHYELTHRLKAKVIESESIVIMNYCFDGFIIPPPDGDGVVWRGYHCDHK